MTRFDIFLYLFQFYLFIFDASQVTMSSWRLNIFVNKSQYICQGRFNDNKKMLNNAFNDSQIKMFFCHGRFGRKTS